MDCELERQFPRVKEVLAVANVANVHIPHEGCNNIFKPRNKGSRSAKCFSIESTRGTYTHACGRPTVAPCNPGNCHTCINTSLNKQTQHLEKHLRLLHGLHETRNIFDEKSIFRNCIS